MKKLLFSIGVCLAATATSFGQIPKLEYAIQYPRGVKFIDVDDAGNVYVAGVLDAGGDTFGGFSLSSNGERDVFVLKIDPSGTTLWAKSFGGPNDDEVYAMDVDPNGQIVLGGEFLDDVDFDPGTGDFTIANNSDATDGYVLRLDPDGDFRWAGAFGGVENDGVKGVAFDSPTNIYVTGYFSDNADLDPNSGVHSITTAGVDAFFVKLDEDGSLDWVQTVGNDDYANGIGATVDFTGTPIFTGHYFGTLDINPGAGTQQVTSSADENNIFIIKLNTATGAFIWGGSIGGDGVSNAANAVYADGQNNIYVTGHFFGTGDFDPGTGEKILSSVNGSSDTYVAKIHPSGNLLWAHAFGGSSDDDWAAGVYADGSGNVYVSGTFQGIVDFDPGPGEYLLAQPGEADIFILKLDAAGTLKWVGQIGEEDGEEGGWITGDPAGNIYTSGEFFSRPDVDMDPSGCVLNMDPETAPAYILKFGTTLPPCLTIYLEPQNVNACKGNTATFTVGASGTNLSYQWYTQSSEGEFDIPVPNNSVFSGAQTATLTVNTSTLALGYSESFVVEVTGNETPFSQYSNIVNLFVVAAPPAISVSRCGPGTVTLKITDFVFNATYNWYTTASGGTPIPGVTGTTYTTPYLTTTTTYYVERELGSCQGPRAAVTATIANCPPIPELVWANSIAPNGRIADMYVDGETGTSYVTGYFSGTGDFEPGPGETELSGEGSTDVFVGKYREDGSLMWAGLLGGVSQDDCNALTVDNFGNVLVAGYFLGTGDFDPGPADFPLISAGSWDMFIVKLDPNGNFLWAKRIGGAPTSGDIPAAIKTDADGNVYVAGSFTGTVDMDPGTPVLNVPSAGNTDGVILKLDPDGNYMTHIVLAGQRFDRFNDLEIDGAGNIYATGYFQQNTDFDPGPGTAIEPGTTNVDENAFVMKMTSTGALVWYRTYVEASTNQYGGSVDLDSDGNLIVGGMFEGTIDFDPGTGNDVRTAIDRDNFVMKFDPNGNYIWGRTLPDYYVYSGFADVTGTDVYLQGSFYNTMDMDPGPGTFNLTSEGQGNSYIVKLNKDGDFQWGLQMGGPYSDGLLTMGFDDSGNIYTGGTLHGTGDYDPGPDIFNLEPIGASGASFVKLGAPGPALFVTTQPTSQNACVGGTASFTVAALGTTNIEYQWEVYDDLANEYENVNDGGGYSGANTATLSVNTTGNFGAGTYRCRISGDGVTDIASDEVDLVIVTSLTPPTTQPTSRCGPGSVTVEAFGSSNGNYRWYTTATGGSPISGQVNNTYTTTISATTDFHVSVVSGSCESTRTPVTATMNPVPAAPVIANITRCTNATATLTPSGGTPGGYRWYDVATGGSPISTGDTYTTPVLTANVTYYVSSSSAGCESPRAAVTITVTSCANNQPPVIVTTTSSAGIQGSVSIDLTPLLSDPDNNLDLATLRIVVQPKSGAVAVIDQNGQLTIDYANTSFAGEDELTIEVCDIAGVCTREVIRINVSDEIEVYNAMSPNGDGKNDIFHIAFIDVIQETRENKVSIFNRWGDLVFEIENYNNTSNVFSGKNNNGNDLPSGTYFYRIVFNNSDRKHETGYLSLKR